MKYTEKQLQSMSDAELNELAAVEVMGWENHFYYANRRYNGVFGVNGVQKDWNPTTDMTDAFEIIRFLKQKGYRFHMSVNIQGNYVAIFKIENKMLEWEADSLEAPRAITMASILAKGE